MFQLPIAGKSEDELLGGMNQLWRRNIKKAAKAGVVVTQGTPEDLEQFHQVYVETAERDFTPRPLSYFTTMFEHLLAEDPDRIGSTWPTTRVTSSRPPPGSGSAPTPGTPTGELDGQARRTAGRTPSSGG